jgi:hypothetical protein
MSVPRSVPGTIPAQHQAMLARMARILEDIARQHAALAGSAAAAVSEPGGERPATGGADARARRARQTPAARPNGEPDRQQPR